MRLSLEHLRVVQRRFAIVGLQTAVGREPRVEQTGGFERGFKPNLEAHAVYDRVYAEYMLLHDWFGRGGNDSMHRLKALKLAAASVPA